MLKLDRATDGSGGSAARWWQGAVVASVALPLLLFIISAAIAFKAQDRETRSNLLRTVDIIYEHATKVFETQELAAAQVNEILYDVPDAAIRAREPEFNARLKGLTARLAQVSDIWVLDETGHPLVAANFLPVPKDIDLSDRSYFQALVDGSVKRGDVFISELMRGRANPDMVFFQASMARTGSSGRSGPFSGAIAISVNPSYFSTFYKQVAESGFSTVGLSRADGQILARYPRLPDAVAILPPQSFFLDAIARAPERGLFAGESSFEKVSRYIAYRKLQDYPVYVTIGVDRKSIVTEWLQTMSMHLVFGLPATIFLCALTLTAYRRARREEAAWARFRQEVDRREQVEAQLRQSQKMEAIGRLTGGIAHDFNNLLTIIRGSLELVQRRTRDMEPREARLIGTAVEGADRASKLTHRLLAFSRQQPLEPRTLDVNRLVGGMSELLRRTLGERIEIETVLTGGLWPILADPNQLENALINLAVNARDAMEDGGRMTIETANAHLDEAYAAAETEVKPGQYVMIAVSDTGTGMTPEVIAKAFEPFFTTKEAGAGTGLGLSQVFGFVKQSGGHIKIYSERDRGTVLKMYFPRNVAALPEDVGPIEGPEIDPRGGGDLIVVVEDEPAVRQYTVDALRDLGYEALEAPDAQTALRLLDHNPGIRLLLTDVVMPGMDGRRLSEAALAKHPNLKVLFMTGYTRNAIIHNGTLDAGVNLLTKPFSLARLAAKVREVLDGPAS